MGATWDFLLLATNILGFITVIGLFHHGRTKKPTWLIGCTTSFLALLAVGIIHDATTNVWFTANAVSHWMLVLPLLAVFGIGLANASHKD